MVEVESMCNEQWPANVKLEYLKKSLRTTVCEVLKNLNKEVKDELEDIESEIM